MAVELLSAELAESVESRVTAALESLGWQKSNGSAIARKAYDTAVGKKEALAYLYDVRSETGCFKIQGEYWSEGSDALSTGYVYIWDSSTDEIIQSKALLFSSIVDAEVAQTYAARLLHPVSDEQAAQYRKVILDTARYP